MYRPGPDPPQFRPVPAAPPPPSMMNMGQYVPHNPVPPSMPPLMPPAGPHSIPPSMPPPSMPSSMPPLGPPSIPAPPTISGRPYAMPQFSFPAPSVARPSAPTLPALGPPLPMMQPSPPVAVTHSPLSMASGHHHSLTGHRPPLFLPPLPPSPPSENPPPPPPSPPPPLPPPPPAEESTVVRLLPPQPLKPSDQEILKNIDVLVPYVVKNGPKFESFTRAKQAGDPKFSFLFEDNGSLEGVVAHEYYKWKKKCFELQLEAEGKASKQSDYGRALGRTQEADGMPRQVANEEDMIAPASPAMSDMDMEDDFAVSPPRRENVGQSGHVKTADFAVVPPKRENTEQSGHVHTSTSVEIDLSSEKCAIIPSDSSSTHLAGASKFGTISHKQDPLLVFGSAAKTPATGCTTEMDQSPNVGGKEIANEQMSTTKAGTDYQDNTLNSGKQIYSTERPSYDFNTEEGFSVSSGIPQVHDSVESIDKRSLLVAGINIMDQDAHVGTSSTLKIVNQSVDEFLPRTLDHSSRQMTRLPQEHRAARVSRWGTLPPSPTLQENQDDEKQYQAGRSQADRSGRREEGASPTRKSSSFEDVHESPTKKSSSPKDIHVSLKGSNRKEEVEFVNDKPGADAGLQRHTDNMLVDEFGRIVREGMSESDSEERRRPRKHRRSRSRSRGRNGSRSRSRSGGRGRSRSMSRSISRSRSPEGSRWRRRSFSPSPHRRGRWSRSRSRSPPWRRSYSRTPPRDSRWGGPGRGSRDWRGDREFYGRGRRGGRGGGPNLCIHYARGRCARGTACRYLHADREFMPQERGPWMRDERLDPPNARDGENMAQDRGAQWARKQRHEFVNARDGEAMPRERGGWIREGGVQADRTELGNARDCEAMVQDRSSWPREEAHERFHARDVGTDQHAQFLERQGVEPVSKWGKIQANADDASAVGKSFDPKEAHMLVATDAEVEARKLDFGEKRESYQKFDLDGVVEKVDIRKVLEHSKVPEKGDGEVSIEVNMASDSPTGMDIVDVENVREGTKKAGESDATEDNNAVVRLKSGQETCVRIKTEDDGTTDAGDQPGIVNKTTLMTENDPVEKFSATERAEIGEGGFSDAGDVGVVKKMDLSSTSLKLQGLDVRVPRNFGLNEDENQQVVEEENHSSKVHKVNESMEKPDQAVGGKEDSLDVQVEEKSRMNKDIVKQAEVPKRPEVKSNEEHSLPWESGPLVQSSQKTALMTPVSGVASAHVLTAAAAAPPSLSYSQANSMGPPLSTATSLAFGQPPTSIGRPYMPGYVQQQTNAPAHTFPPGNMPPYSQANSFVLPANNLQNVTAGQTPSPGNFNVLQPPPFGHQPYGQQAGVVSGSVPRQSFPPGNATQYRPNLFPGPPMHEGPYQQGLNFGGVFPPRPGISQSSIVPQQPVQQLQSGFPANQRLGFPSHVPPQGPPNMPYPVYPANLGVPPEQQPLPRPFTSDSPMQYLHPTSIDSGVQNAYGRSLTLPQSSMPWALPTSSEVSVMSQRTGQPSAYSYSLTTVPPLKVPGVIELKSPADQYDPLSDCLDPNPKSITLASNALSARLENVSPGPMEKTTHEVEAANVNEAGADVGVVENVSPPGNWSPEQPVDGAEGGQDQAQSKSKKNSRGLKLLRSAVAEHVKELLKPTWREGHLSKEAFKTIAKKAVDKVTGNLPNHHIPKSQEKVDHFMAVSRTKISKLVQGYVDKYLKL